MDITLPYFIEDMHQAIRGMSIVPAFGEVNSMLRALAVGRIRWDLALMLCLLADAPLHQMGPLERLAKINAALCIYTAKVAPHFQQPGRRIV